jgi:transcriptional regulator GlxA family with amidase domain
MKSVAVFPAATDNPSPTPRRQTMHSVALMVYPNFQSLSLSLGSVFECANLLRGEPAYEFHLVSENGGAVMTSQGSR